MQALRIRSEYRAEWSLIGKDEAIHTQFQWAGLGPREPCADKELELW